MAKKKTAKKKTAKKKATKKTKSFRDRLRQDREPEIVEDRRTGGSLLIPTPVLIAEVVGKVRKGKLTTPSRIREQLARSFGADNTCPLCTGIFLNFIAGAAEEDLASGKKRVTPYWRVVKDNGALAEKFPPGMGRQKELLEAEGHAVEKPKRGKIPVVVSHEESLV